MKKTIVLLGVITYFILIAFTQIMYLERTVIMDVAFHLFNILKDGDFAIQVNRFGAIFTQSFPLLGSKIGLGLDTILKMYSFSFVCLHFLVFIASIIISRTYKFGLVMLLFSTLLMTHTYYWIQSELIQGMSFLVLYYSILYRLDQDQLTEKIWFIPLVTMLIFTIIFFHPLLVFPFLFIGGYFYFNKTISTRILIQTVLIFLPLYVLKTKFIKTDYDSRSMDNVENFWNYFPNLWDIPANVDFVRYVVQDYQLFLIAFVAVIAAFVYKKAFKKLLYFMCFFFGYLFLVNICYPTNAEQFYIESLYLPLSIFIVIPLVFDYSDKISVKYVLIVLIICIGFRLSQIYITHDYYTKRVEYLSSILDKIQQDSNQKLLLKVTDKDSEELLMTWATAYEFWLLSTLKTGKSASIMIHEDPSSFQWLLPNTQVFITNFGFFEYNKLPAPYFRFENENRYVIRE